MIFRHPFDKVFFLGSWIGFDLIPCLTILRDDFKLWPKEPIFDENKTRQTRSTTSGSELGGGGSLPPNFYVSFLGAVFDFSCFEFSSQPWRVLMRLQCYILSLTACFKLIRRCIKKSEWFPCMFHDLCSLQAAVGDLPARCVDLEAKLDVHQQ